MMDKEKTEVQYLLFSPKQLIYKMNLKEFWQNKVVICRCWYHKTTIFEKKERKKQKNDVKESKTNTEEKM